ncbi:kinase-like domain-containing protein [Coprinopsis sp. MPI-PUGE-AT-0042]|nr:kinase-like domain-containing protein [Coprinopsis sp. MPI-PUGE-AT-0042]
MSAQLASSQFRARPEDTLKDGRYSILRKLGESTDTTVWLVKDSMERSEKYLAAKILSVEATMDADASREAQFMQKITDHYRDKKRESKQGYYHLPRLFDSFDIAAGGQKHLCLMMPVYTTSVGFLRRSSPAKSLPDYLVKKLISMALEALEILHSIGIAHGDVNADDILFSDKRAYVDPPLATYLDNHDPSVDEGGYFLKSQPLPNEWLYKTPPSEAERMDVAIVNFRHSEWMNESNKETKTSIDMGAVGQLTFGLLTGRDLMFPKDGGSLLTVPSGGMEHPIQGGRLHELQSDAKGNKSPLRSLREVLANFKPVTDARDIDDASNFIKLCFEPNDATLKQLRSHTFFDSVVQN